MKARVDSREITHDAEIKPGIAEESSVTALALGPVTRDSISPGRARKQPGSGTHARTLQTVRLRVPWVTPRLQPAQRRRFRLPHRVEAHRFTGLFDDGTNAEKMNPMDTSRFDALGASRSLTAVRSRRGIAGGLLLSAAALLGSPFGTAQGAPNGSKPLKQCKKRLKRTRTQLNRCKVQLKPHVCAGKNWCVDRSQTCGPTGGYGKCFVEAGGRNTCAEVMFQAKTCADCAAPACKNCQCALAAGGGDRCNNGATGYDFICVRPV
jgi:hypothetical protein